MPYSIINTLIVQSDPELSAAHAHGMATGMLCVNEQTQSPEWLAELFLHAIPATDADSVTLTHLFEETKSLLAGDEFEFDLLLPGDEVLLSEQVVALTHWCQGFLLGFGFTQADTVWSKEAKEILKDIIEFTKLETEAEGEDDENDFVEITEYIRSAVLLLRSEVIKDGER
jgi:uncharacterized protein YgfB (UPF0149 family)